MADSKLTTPAIAAEAEESAALAKRQKITKAILLSGFLSVCQHVMCLQSEPMLMKELYGGDIAKAARTLANSQGIVGALALVLNQFGGKLTDAVGRKPGLLVGPLGNILLGLLVFLKPTSRSLVIVCRIIRMVLTTFSNTVVASAAYADVLKGKELAVIGSTVGAVVGSAVVVTPFIEALVLRKFQQPKYSFLFLSLFAGLQAATTVMMVPETLPVEKRIDISKAVNIQALNPFGFVKIFTQGSTALNKLVAQTTMQYCSEGKNVSDYAMQWWTNHLKWSTDEIRNFLMTYGFTCIAGGVLVVPNLAKNLSPRAFTSFTNWSNTVNYLVKAFAGPSAVAYIAASAIGLPGVNAASGTVLRATLTEKAVQEGFGKGEFSAWVSNLRAVVSAASPVIYGNLYASMSKTFPSVGFLAIGILGAGIPEILLWATTDEELQTTS